LSMGDFSSNREGLQGRTGLEMYIYERRLTVLGLQRSQVMRVDFTSNRFYS